MFENLGNRLNDVFSRLTRKGVLGEADVDEALRQVRVALLEADVALPVVKEFIDAVRDKAVGDAVIRSVTPGQMVVKIVAQELTELLGGEGQELNLAASPPAVILMVGLQGSGKTTTAAKIAVRLTGRSNKTVLMASLDTARPAAQEQLAILGRQAGIPTLPVVAGQGAADIARRALASARLEGYDIVIMDTAGRLAVDDDMMAEAARIHALVNPVETLLVADAMTGQDAVNTARAFAQTLHVTGIVLTRIDGDARGGAALSMRKVAGVPIKLMGTGEQLDALEDFHPERIASRILGMGDIVTLVEKAAEQTDREEAERLAAKMVKGSFDLDDMADQLLKLTKMGGLQGMMGMLPGARKIKSQLAAAHLDDKLIGRQVAIIRSMTRAEKCNTKLLNGSRRRRIAAGSGTEVQDVNRVLKQYREMSKMMKKVGKLSKLGLAQGGLPGMGPGMAPGMAPGGLPPGMGRFGG
ncbi:MAG: signal recognition particle protein [Alphaproteobacteria bacterium]|nr:MAG: signal recognition particle protein [Alphaproteobacteria bacterium]